MVPEDKGIALERAVHVVEAVILQTSPALREKPFRIEMRKRLHACGVHHEIDIFVTVEIAKGYNATFTFECKNWTAPVGKNEIIVLAEKIDATVAGPAHFAAFIPVGRPGVVMRFRLSESSIAAIAPANFRHP
jgi:hypothetical protein